MYFEDEEGVVLYYDEDDDLIGLEPVEDKDADDAAYTVSKTDSGGTVTPKAFMQKYDLTFDVTTQYEPEWDDERELIIVDPGAPIGKYGTNETEESTSDE